MDSIFEVLTIGHSTQSYEEFLRRLKIAGVTAIGDVRSAPYSRHLPHFNRETLKQELEVDGVRYVFLGDELGGRPKDKRFFCGGVADYEKMATTDAFKHGLDRVAAGAKKHKIALMCSEHDPMDCHRCLLVGRALAERDFLVRHILGNGQIITHREIEEKLLEASGRTEDLFETRERQLAEAYRQKAMRVAYSERTGPLDRHVAAG